MCIQDAQCRIVDYRFTAAKPDSQDICFVPEGRYTGIVERLRPDAARPGEIVIDPNQYGDAAISGTITVTNDAPIDAVGVVVTDALSIDGSASVTCPSDTVPANGSLVCTYSADPSSGATQTNTATASFAGNDYASSAKTVDFSTATVTKIDDCITVTDDLYGDLGSACATDTLPKTFNYTRTLGPFNDCGEHPVVNTATFTTNTTETTGSDTWTVTVTVPCPVGCTLTQGYWKTHSIYGPAAHPDDNWTAPSGSSWDTGFNQDSTFYLSGQTYLQVLQTASKGGNPYYILAHQYIAALLNIRAGAATTPEVVAALDYAQTFFNTYTPTSNFSKSVKQAATQAAGVLGSYNEGLIGPGHCSEDSIAVAGDQ